MATSTIAEQVLCCNDVRSYLLNGRDMYLELRRNTFTAQGTYAKVLCSRCSAFIYGLSIIAQNISSQFQVHIPAIKKIRPNVVTIQNLFCYCSSRHFFKISTTIRRDQYLIVYSGVKHKPAISLYINIALCYEISLYKCCFIYIKISLYINVVLCIKIGLYITKLTDLYFIIGLHLEIALFI